MIHWKRTADGLPRTYGRDYLVLNANGRQAVATLRIDGWYIGLNKLTNVTHYKRLDPLPKEYLDDQN